MKRRTFLFAAAAVAVALPALADGDAGAPREVREVIEGAKLDALLADAARARKDVRSLRGNFEQTRKISLLATSVRSTGELTFLAPERLRWDLAAPDDVVYFVGPEGLTYKTKTSSATVPQGKDAHIARALADVRALLGGDLGSLKQRYALTATKSGSDVELKGTALDKNASVRAFTLLLDKGLVVPLRSRLLEGKSDSIELVFSNVVVNGPVDPARVHP